MKKLMPILDKDGREIVWLKNFPNDDNVDCIEIVAGKNCFGKKYFPLCYLLDRTHNNLPHFSSLEDYETEDCHFLDHITDFVTLDVNGKQFSNIIFCNPYEIGFIGKEFAKEFLNKTASMLCSNGVIHIIGHTSNVWSKYHNANKYTSKLIMENELICQFKLSAPTTLTQEHEYIRFNRFTRVNINKQTVPNEMFTITKI